MAMGCPDLTGVSPISLFGKIEICDVHVLRLLLMLFLPVFFPLFWFFFSIFINLPIECPLFSSFRKIEICDKEINNFSTSYYTTSILHQDT
jgi:hypothetical protein